MADEEEPARLNPHLDRVFTLSGIEVDFFVAVVCSDKGQHPRTVLSMARRELGGGHGMSHALEWFAPPMDDRESPRMSRSSYTFACPRCPRRPVIRAATWWRLVDEVGRVGRADLDISLLP